ncbi:ice-binding family protein [Aequorivita sublithincola]|nr:ice-binding family protein [Aequorivita sublithincola]
MNNYTKKSITTLINLKCFFGIILMIAFILPATALSQSPLPVNLGTSSNFVVLAKSGISTTGTTSIVGNIGVSPIDHTAITGFSLILDPSGQFATSSLVDGKIFASNYTSPTPTLLTTAVSDMETAYTDAAGRIPDYTELYAGDLTGQTLTTGVYKWGTNVLVSAGGVTISGSPTDVWIFEIAQDLIIANGAIITLSGGAKASNIFWQVAGQVTLGTTSDFSGNILCQTQIAMQTGATFDGRALSQTAVTLDGNSVVLGINESSLDQDLALYPNPTTNVVNLVNKTNISLEKMMIYDIIGKLVSQTNLREMQGEKAVDVSSLAAGVYVVQIIGNNASTVKRLIKQYSPNN